MRRASSLCILIPHGFNAYSPNSSSFQSGKFSLVRQPTLRSHASDNGEIQTSPFDEELETVEEVGRKVLQKYFNFPLDKWQAESGGEILRNKNLIVTAATGKFLLTLQQETR